MLIKTMYVYKISAIQKSIKKKVKTYPKYQHLNPTTVQILQTLFQTSPCMWVDRVTVIILERYFNTKFYV